MQRKYSTLHVQLTSAIIFWKKGVRGRDGTGSPGHGSPGHRVTGSAIWVRVGSVTDQSPDRLFLPGFLSNVVKNCRQSVSFIIIMRYRGH